MHLSSTLCDTRDDRYSARMMKLIHLASRLVVQRTSSYGVARAVSRTFVVLPRYITRSQCQRLSSSSASRAAEKKRDLDEDLLKMDIDLAEKHMKEWFGDHASWDHKKLRKLIYGNEIRVITRAYADSKRGKTGCDTASGRLRRLRYEWIST